MSNDTMNASNSHAKINDRIRREGLFGEGMDTPLFITPGVAALGAPAMGDLVLAFMSFDKFDPDLDPDGHHEMGEINHFGTRVWFKFDRHPEIADARIITFLLPEEY